MSEHRGSRPPHSRWWDEWLFTRWEFYDWYKRSADWGKRRKARMHAVGYACQRCGTPDSKQHPLEVDHLTYIRLGNEHDSDLIVLCKSCHDEKTRSRNGMGWQQRKARDA